MEYRKLKVQSYRSDATSFVAAKHSFAYLVLNLQSSIVIIGGGITGAGIARDLVLRGFDVILLEKSNFAAGASVRNHGLLHSGVRYAVNDSISAAECYKENLILKKIAPHCIENTKGYFVLLKNDDESYKHKLLSACHTLNIPVKEIDEEEALICEPLLNRELCSVIEAPDASVDSFLIIKDTLASAIKNNAKVLYHTEVIDFIIDKQNVQNAGTDLRVCLSKNQIVKGVIALNKITGEKFTIKTDFVINAAGAWTSNIAELAGIKINMKLSKGTLLVSNRRLSNRVINRMRMPCDGDIIVPNYTVSIFGTTSIPVLKADPLFPESGEIQKIIQEGNRLIPGTNEIRFLRAFSGVRPLYNPDENIIADDPLAWVPRLQIDKAGKNGRTIGRSHYILDHSKNGVERFITIVGGKLTTYRRMAEDIGDIVCEKFGINKPSITSEISLYAPNPNESEKKLSPRRYEDTKEILSSHKARKGNKTFLRPFVPLWQETKNAHYKDSKNDFIVLSEIPHRKSGKKIVCECEMVTEKEITNYKLQITKDKDSNAKCQILNQQKNKNLKHDVLKLNHQIAKLPSHQITNYPPPTILNDIRQKTRMGMGTCQGIFCASRCLDLLCKDSLPYDSKLLLEDLKNFIEERYKGEKYFMYGDTLREFELKTQIYISSLNLTR